MKLFVLLAFAVIYAEAHSGIYWMPKVYVIKSKKPMYKVKYNKGIYSKGYSKMGKGGYISGTGGYQMGSSSGPTFTETIGPGRSMPESVGMIGTIANEPGFIAGSSPEGPAEDFILTSEGDGTGDIPGMSEIVSAGTSSSASVPEGGSPFMAVSGDGTGGSSSSSEIFAVEGTTGRSGEMLPFGSGTVGSGGSSQMYVTTDDIGGIGSSQMYTIGDDIGGVGSSASSEVISVDTSGSGPVNYVMGDSGYSQVNYASEGSYATGGMKGYEVVSDYGYKPSPKKYIIRRYFKVPAKFYSHKSIKHKRY